MDEAFRSDVFRHEIGMLAKSITRPLDLDDGRMVADLKDYFGSVDHDKLLALVGKQIADSKVLKLIQQMLKARHEDKGRQFETPQGS